MRSFRRCIHINIASGRKQAPTGPIKLMHRVYKYVLPGVEAELAKLKSKANLIPDAELRQQALNSIRDKKFHCQGGGIYGAVNLQYHTILTSLIVALQTISDYLDNLCDRSTSLDEQDFRMLHQSMLDAVTPNAPLQDYYAYRNEKDDAGYLQGLVLQCQEQISHLPSYDKVQPYVIELVSLYCDLQVYKHIAKELREPKLLQWWESHRSSYPQLHWNEFAAATGSTLGMFMLFLNATDPTLTAEEGQQFKNIYFPHVCALHILLDYLIDQEEDKVGGDLNFCSYYNNEAELVERIALIVTRARQDVQQLPESGFHSLVIEGLLALYLSDPKVQQQTEVRKVSKQLMRKSPITRLFFLLNSVWIRKQQA